LDWRHSRSQNSARAAEHGSLERFQSVDLAFGLAAALRFVDGRQLRLLLDLRLNPLRSVPSSCSKLDERYS
jgi:hypothetical protein